MPQDPGCYSKDLYRNGRIDLTASKPFKGKLLGICLILRRNLEVAFINVVDPVFEAKGRLGCGMKICG